MSSLRRKRMSRLLRRHPSQREIRNEYRSASVRFGGKKGRTLHIKAGDTVILPAGTLPALQRPHLSTKSEAKPVRGGEDRGGQEGQGEILMWVDLLLSEFPSFQHC